MKYILPLLLVFLVLSCSNNTDEIEQEKTPIDEKKETITNDNSSSKKEEQSVDLAVQENPLTLNDFPKIWYKLDQVEDNYVIHEYCEAETPQIKIEQESDVWYVYVIYGQDGQRFKIIDFDAYEETQENFDVVYGSFVLENPDYPDMDVDLYNYMWNKDQMFCRFEGFFQDATRMVSQQNRDNYTVIKENCDYLDNQ